MNIKTNLLEEYINLVDNTIKQNIYFKLSLIFFVVILFSILILVLFK